MPNKPVKPSRPLLLEELVEQLKPREPLKSPEDLPFELSVTLAATKPPQVDLSVAKVKDRIEGQAYEVKLSIHGATLGKHALPPMIESRQFEPEKDIKERQEEWPDFEGYLPDHLPLQPLPRHLIPELMVPPRIASSPLPDQPEDVHQATTVFPPENRYIFNDTSFPW
jgi:hypothetical protein